MMAHRHSFQEHLNRNETLLKFSVPPVLLPADWCQNDLCKVIVVLVCRVKVRVFFSFLC